MFGVGNSSSVHISNKKKYIYVIDDGITQGLDDTSIMSRTKYSLNFSSSERKFCLSLHYNGRNNFLFVNTTKIYQFKASSSELKPY